jgi:hypothetical protein
MSAPAPTKRAPGSLAERFWAIAKSTGPMGDDTTNIEPVAVVRHVLRILDALSAGEVGDELSRATVSFVQMLRQQEHAGDLSYASPEQARGEAVDERSLVFSVGVLMFEELTGRHPFGAMASGRRFARIQKCELGSGVQYFPQVPAQLRNVLMKAMGPFPEERYRSLDELREHLERFVDGRPDDDVPTRMPRRPLRGLAPTHADLAFATVEEAMPTRVQRRPEPPYATRAQSRSQPQRAFSVISSAPPPPPLARPDEPTRVVAAPMRTPVEPARAVVEPARAAVEPSRSAVEPTMVVAPRVGHSTDKLMAYDPPRAFAVLERIAYVACGALLALVLAYFALRHKAPAPVIAGPLGPRPVTTPLTTRNIEPPALPTSEPEPNVFDPELAGRNAAKAARACFAPERAARTISFGVGVMWGKNEALSRRMFLSPDEPLQPDERRCIAHAVVGIAGGAAPARTTIVEYRLRLRPDGSDDVRATVQK